MINVRDRVQLKVNSRYQEVIDVTTGFVEKTEFNRLCELMLLVAFDDRPYNPQMLPAKEFEVIDT